MKLKRYAVAALLSAVAVSTVSLMVHIWLPDASAHTPPKEEACEMCAAEPEEQVIQVTASTTPAPVSSNEVDLGAFEKRCRWLVPIAYDSWVHQVPQWEEFFPAFIWQMALESSCREDIVNSIGAAGLGQLLETAASDCRKHGLEGSRREAVFNTQCSAWLQGRSGRLWRSHRSEECRLVLVWAGHLTGSGWLVRAQKAARNNGELAVCFNDGIGEYLGKVISEENARHAHWYVSWIAHHSGVAKDRLLPPEEYE